MPHIVTTDNYAVQNELGFHALNFELDKYCECVDIDAYFRMSK